MDFSPSECTAYGGLRIKQEVKIEKNPIVDTESKHMASLIGMDEAYEMSMCIKIEPETVSLGLVNCRV